MALVLICSAACRLVQVIYIYVVLCSSIFAYTAFSVLCIMVVHIVCLAGNSVFLTALTTNPGELFTDLQPLQGQTPLTIAASNGHRKVVAWLEQGRGVMSGAGCCCRDQSPLPVIRLQHTCVPVCPGTGAILICNSSLGHQVVLTRCGRLVSVQAAALEEGTADVAVPVTLRWMFIGP